jgi:hypothetical protein
MWVNDSSIRVSVRRGNQSRTSGAQSASLIAGTPDSVNPAAIAGSMYLRTVLRSRSSDSAISACDCPACQCTRISVISIT